MANKRYSMKLTGEILSRYGDCVVDEWSVDVLVEVTEAGTVVRVTADDDTINIPDRKLCARWVKQRNPVQGFSPLTPHFIRDNLHKIKEVLGE